MNRALEQSRNAGRHSGFLQQLDNMGVRQISRMINSLTQSNYCCLLERAYPLTRFTRTPRSNAANIGIHGKSADRPLTCMGAK